MAGVGNQCMAALDAGCARASRRTGTRMNWSKDMQAMKKVSQPCLSFLSVLSLSSSSHFFPQVLPFINLSINHGIHLRLIQTCLYLRRYTPLGKTLTVAHYLCTKYFSKAGKTLQRVTTHEPGGYGP